MKAGNGRGGRRQFVLGAAGVGLSAAGVAPLRGRGLPPGVHVELGAVFLTIAVLLIAIGRLALTLLSEADAGAGARTSADAATAGPTR